jgi:hypothetical protein
MLLYDTLGADQRAVISGNIRVTSKYTIKFKIYELYGDYAGVVIWDPHLPSSTKQKALARKIDAALMPCLAKILKLGGMLERGDV